MDKKIVEERGCQSFVKVFPQLPLIDAATKITQSDAVFLPISRVFKGQIPVKLYDYIAAKKPIIMVNGEGSEAESILRETESGKNAESIQEIKLLIDEVVLDSISCSFDKEKRYSRHTQSVRLFNLLKSITD